jgi:acyl-CoA dehydrogenase
MVEMALIVEQLAAAGGGCTVGQLFMINPIFGGVSISRFGTEAMKRDVLPKIISGEINCCMALTEPDAGSNSLETKTFATRTGNGWRLSGQKIWITGVDSASSSPRSGASSMGSRSRAIRAYSSRSRSTGPRSSVRG